MKNLIKQTSLLTITNVVTRVAGMLFFIILARALSVSDYGLFRYLIAISGMYAILFTGIPTALTKYISEQKNNNKKTSEYLTNSVLLMFVSFLILSIFILLLNSHNFFVILFLFAILIDSIYLGYVRGLLNYTKLSGFKLIENIIQLIILLISYLIFKQINFTFAVIFFSLSGILSLIIFEILRPELKISLIFSKDKINQIIKYTIPVTLGSIGWTLMFGINAIFINHFYNTEEFGYYSVGITLVQVFSFLPEAISTLMLPKVAGTKNKNKIPKYIILSVLGTIILSGFILVFLLFFKSIILKTIFTEKYLPALIIILPLSIGQICIALHQIYASACQGLDRPGIPSITISIAAFLNVIGSYFLTKNYGILGASISNAITSFIALIIISTWFHKKWKTLSNT